MKRKQRSKERSSSGILQSHRETVQGDAQQLIAGLMEELKPTQELIQRLEREIRVPPERRRVPFTA
jgi:hypothetical protein